MLQIDVKLLDGIYRSIQLYPEHARTIAHSFKSNQLLSKQEVSARIPAGSTVCLLGGWYAIGFMLTHPHASTSFTSVDIDPQCALIGRSIGAPNYKFVTSNALTYDPNFADIVVNCSTEHMDREHLQFSFANIQTGKRCIFQNNNGFGVDDHVNCFEGIQSFRDYVSEQFTVNEAIVTRMDNGSERYTVSCTKT